jgi:hypothetical protein
MRFCSEIDYCTRLVFFQQSTDYPTVANIACHKDVPSVFPQTNERVQITSVGQFVEIDNGLVMHG